jgi:hypothetical protein
VRSQLPNARLRRLEIVDADVGLANRSRRPRAERPPLEHLPPGKLVFLDQIVRRLGGRGPLAGMVRAQKSENSVEADEVLLLNSGLPRLAYYSPLRTSFGRLLMALVGFFNMVARHTSNCS